MKHLELRPEEPPTPRPPPVLPPKLRLILKRTFSVAAFAAGALIALTACIGGPYLMLLSAAMGELSGGGSPLGIIFLMAIITAIGGAIMSLGVQTLTTPRRTQRRKNPGPSTRGSVGL